MPKPKPKPKVPKYGSWVTIKPVPPHLKPIGMIDYRWDYVDDNDLNSVLPKRKLGAVNHTDEEDDHV